jgi:hypothetical protein
MSVIWISYCGDFAGENPFQGFNCGLAHPAPKRNPFLAGPLASNATRMPKPAQQPGLE